MRGEWFLYEKYPAVKSTAGRSVYRLISGRTMAPMSIAAAMSSTTIRMIMDFFGFTGIPPLVYDYDVSL